MTDPWPASACDTWGQNAGNMLQLHHVIVYTAPGAPEAQGLLDAGLVEGSPNVHPGQGTANRRFFFASGFLELLWVHDEREARSPLTAATRLWDRWAQRGGAASPFGLCFSSIVGARSELPFATWAYRPSYLTEDRSIRFADGIPLAEPEIFLLSWPQSQASPDTEPTEHPAGLSAMRSVSIGLPDPAGVSGTLGAIADSGMVKTHFSAKPELIIEFAAKETRELNLPELGISLVGRPV